MTVPHLSLPPPELLRRQSDRLREVRARLLRRVQIGLRRRILDLGCGYGFVTSELCRRGAGTVVALDAQPAAFLACTEEFRTAMRICGTAENLPVADATFDLVCSQFAFLWMNAPPAVAELRRVIEPGGVLIAIEPDYGGMIEEPAELRSQAIWQRALRRAGANPDVGRTLPRLLAEQDFDVRVELVPEVSPWKMNEDRFEFLRELPLHDDDRRAIERMTRAEQNLTSSWSRLAYLPILLITAWVPPRDRMSARSPPPMFGSASKASTK